ncbi:MAG: hypothetical protein M3Y45_01005 [Actinomycetota bacterium]|nr:hypothetical protein [Actinomycetota bacterium]
MTRTENRVTRVVTSDRAPKAAAAVVLSGALIAGAENVAAVSLTAATLAVAEVARGRFGVKGLRSSATRAHDTRPRGPIGPAAGRTP